MLLFAPNYKPEEVKSWHIIVFYSVIIIALVIFADYKIN